MELCSRQGSKGTREKTQKGRSMVSGFFRYERRERAGSDGEGPLSGMGEAGTVQCRGSAEGFTPKAGCLPGLGT